MRKAKVDAARPPNNQSQGTKALNTAVLIANVAPHVIYPDAVYGVAEVQAALGLKPSTVRTELRKRRLRVAKRSGRYYILGAWLLEWLRAGELHHGAQACACEDEVPTDSNSKRG